MVVDWAWMWTIVFGPKGLVLGLDLVLAYFGSGWFSFNTRTSFAILGKLRVWNWHFLNLFPRVYNAI